jgi:hypothetical protein
MEKREVWQNIEDDPETKEPRLLLAIYLADWRILYLPYGSINFLTFLIR